MARLDRLEEEPKRAIQLASIIGREFAWRLLQRIHEASDQLEGILSELRALELIYEKAAHPELAYMFKHALTHEVAYESVLVQRRKNLHRVVGDAIEELYPDRLTEHYEALRPPLRRRENSSAHSTTHELASEKSLRTYANYGAIDHCRKALGLAEQLPEVDRDRMRELWERIGIASWMVSDFRRLHRRVRRGREPRRHPHAAREPLRVRLLERTLGPPLRPCARVHRRRARGRSRGAGARARRGRPHHPGRTRPRPRRAARGRRHGRPCARPRPAGRAIRAASPSPTANWPSAASGGASTGARSASPRNRCGSRTATGTPGDALFRRVVPRHLEHLRGRHRRPASKCSATASSCANAWAIAPSRRAC